ncbi:MAG TPA: inorganic diphosphatase [Candidatus Saccharibacteria bacterium]|mgnify:CR=1 FL=1|nr:inorganic diphosphatase [Candidatus Saccharibacteria bacterium]
MDFNAILTSGDVVAGIITTVVEIPKGSKLKAEYDRKKKIFVLDRVEPGIFAKPVSYGFIPQTLDDDGDELDTLIICDEPLPMGLVVEKARVIGVLKFEDGGEMDHKVIVVPADDRDSGDSIKSLDDLSPALLKQIEHHFTHYKDLKKPGTTKVMGFGDVEEAKEVINECIERWNAQA